MATLSHAQSVTFSITQDSGLQTVDEGKASPAPHLGAPLGGMSSRRGSAVGGEGTPFGGQIIVSGGGRGASSSGERACMHAKPSDCGHEGCRGALVPAGPRGTHWVPPQLVGVATTGHFIARGVCPVPRIQFRAHHRVRRSSTGAHSVRGAPMVAGCAGMGFSARWARAGAPGSPGTRVSWESGQPAGPEQDDGVTCVDAVMTR
jgi:hypothetical protein